MKVIIFIGGIVVAAAAYLLSRKKSAPTAQGGYCKLTRVSGGTGKSLKDNSLTSQTADTPADQFFNNVIEKYKEKLLANCVLNAAESAGFDAEQRLKLTEKYGLVSLIPMLYSELSGFKEAGLRYNDIEKAAEKWLKKNNAECVGIDNIDSIEKVLKKMMQQKAESIIRATTF